MSNPKLDLVQGWKNIAAYVDRDVSTVKRWERSRGLPVRRVPGQGRANVYAHTAELAQWLSGVKPTSPDMAGRPAGPESGPATERTSIPDIQQPEIISRELYKGRTVTSVTAVIVVCVALLAGATYNHISGASKRKIAAVEAAYVSQIPGVQETYLRGEYLYEQRTPDTMQLALVCFQDATTRDPADAEAWAGLADAYMLLHEYGVTTLDDAYPPLKAAARHAITLRPAMSEPHSTLGFADFFWTLDVKAAEQEFATALRLDPFSATAHSRYGVMLTYESRFPEALVQLDLAEQLDPKSTAILANRAFALGLSGHRDEAVSLLEQVGYNDRNASVLHHLGVLSQMEPRHLPVFLDQARRLSEFRHDEYGKQMYAEAERTFKASGEKAMWQALLERTERVTPQPHIETLNVARYEAFLGQDEEAFYDLETMARVHKAALVGILIDPAFQSLHRDSRFARLIAEVGLPATAETDRPVISQ